LIEQLEADANYFWVPTDRELESLGHGAAETPAGCSGPRRATGGGVQTGERAERRVTGAVARTLTRAPARLSAALVHRLHQALVLDVDEGALRLQWSVSGPRLPGRGPAR
jgi:hypothetical protein